MLMLSEPQIEIVMTAAGGLPAEKRGLFVEKSLHGCNSAAPCSPTPISTFRRRARRVKLMAGFPRETPPSRIISGLHYSGGFSSFSNFSSDGGGKNGFKFALAKKFQPAL